MESRPQQSREETILVARQDVFYDVELQDNQQQREFSEIIFLKKFNNWTKTVLINKYCNKLRYNKSPSIFDLCSGKGGDLEKWLRLKPSHYVALEYQQALIDNSIDRLAQKRDIKFPSIFIVADAGDERNTIDKILDNEVFKDIRQKIVFDLVSCQFSMHYLFETENKLRAFLHNVSCRLEPGGFFIATTVDAEKVTSLIRTEGKENLKIGNRYYSIQFGQDSFPKDGSPYGLKFYFYLKDAVGKERLSEGRPVYVPEYLVLFDNLEKIALEYDLKLVEKTNFHQFYDENIEKQQSLFDRMVMSGVKDNVEQDSINDQWEICGLYLVCAFEKLGTSRKRHHDNFGNYKIRRKLNAREWI